MKKLLTLLILVLLGSFLAFGQCATDTIEPFSHSLFTFNQEPISCYPFKCPVEACHYWQLPDSFKGGLFVFDADATVEILIFDSCLSVLVDTCLFIGVGPFGYSIHYNFPPKSMLVIGGQNDASIGVSIKPDPSGLLNNFGPAICRIDTLCTVPTSIVEPIKPRRLFEFDGQTWRQVTAMKPNRLYKEF